MVVRVLLFAVLRERAGTESLEIDLDDGATVEDALTEIRRMPGMEVLDRLPVRMAVNRDYAESSRRLAGGDELALVPPVSGGAADADGVHAAVTGEPLDQSAITARVSRPAAGAVVTFQGTTRVVTRLQYEAYAEMAAGRIESILREVKSDLGLEAIACEHRVGSVPLSEPSVVVAASAAHRAEAFAGARMAIDRVKAEAPIWKKEVKVTNGPSGERVEERWVEGSVPGGDGA